MGIFEPIVTELVLLVILILALPVWKFTERMIGRRKWKPVSVSFIPRLRKTLSRKVAFYAELSDRGKRKFEFRVLRFLQNHKVCGMGTRVNEVDLALVGASAVIPVFGFDKWRYRGLDEVVVFGPSFDRHLSGGGEEGRVVGLLGEGSASGKMFLCRYSLRKGFAQEKDGDNTAIHEFVHLIDRMDGRVDGIPKLLMSRQYVLPWLGLVQRKIGEIERGESDLNPYASMGAEEFLAVTAEYFFERPEAMKARHPVLHRSLKLIFERSD